ncbi:hypothetical protein QFZ65_003327 [Arthrobacter sp. B3I9]|uniref:hypothetical protein n=1 Tax=Arthrobacter sp. B3I9 TaxID=3042270 RepID=UPI00278E0E09|nr:hypothetical protein [Arthrobacter sp. B3I9]MDQ0851389.1 hypothetical protein [Arthrobacter sp. B3I9]
MTNTGRSQEERRLADERCVDALLAEGGYPDDAGLRDLLLEMRSLRVTEVPRPSAELAALLGQTRPADVTRLEDQPRKHRRKKRAVFTSLAVAASLGIAGGAAAGNDGVRHQAEGTIRNIISTFINPAPATPAPAPPAGAPESAPAVVPSPVATTPVGIVPAAPSPVGAPGSGPSAPDRQELPEAPVRPSQAPQEGAAPSTVPPAPGRAAERGASHGKDAPSRLSGPPAGRAELSRNGNATGKAASDGAPRQDNNQPKFKPAQDDRP